MDSLTINISQIFSLLEPPVIIYNVWTKLEVSVQFPCSTTTGERKYYAVLIQINRLSVFLQRLWPRDEDPEERTPSINTEYHNRQCDNVFFEHRRGIQQHTIGGVFTSPLSRMHGQKRPQIPQGAR